MARYLQSAQLGLLQIKSRGTKTTAMWRPQERRQKEPVSGKSQCARGRVEVDQRETRRGAASGE
jgi:hypothetical protein